MPIASRLTNTGTLLVNGLFDEASLTAGAISFNGTSQYLTATSPNLSGTWTVEMWCYWTTGATQTTIVSFNNGSNSGINLWKNSSNQLVADDGVNGVTPMSTVTPTINAWNHIAFVRSGTTTSGYVNGVLAGTTTYTPGTTSAISVGRYNGGTFFYFPGYISNLRVVNGTAVYTAAFTPPQTILPAITNTSLLLNVVNSANFIQDNSPNVYTVTNNGTATWTATGPFNQGSTTLKQRQVNPSVSSGSTISNGTAIEVYNQFDEASLVSGAVNFNGTSQYLTVAANSALVFTADFTVETWAYATATTNAVDQVFNYGNNTFMLYHAGTTWTVEVGNGTSNFFTLTGTASLNAWHHFAITRSGNTYNFWIDGVSASTTTNANAPATTGATLSIGRSQGTASQWFTGYLSNFRMVKGTAVYTANFTPPQSMLPAITNTSLLLNVVNSANFIQDNSPNNFTVTNNGTATWIATGPFNQGSTTLKQRLVNDGTLEVYTQFDEFTGAPVVDTSLMVWVDAGQTASYSGSGATWTDLSSNAKNYTLTNSPTFNSITGGGVITFAGASSQYATTASTLFNSTTTNTYSVNIWVYPTGAGQIVSVDGQSTPNSAYHYTAIEITAAGLIYLGQWTGTNTVIASSAQSLNAWYNLVITYNGTTATAYVNGTSVGSSAIAWSAPGASTFFALMSQDSTNMSGTTNYASGSIGAFMVYNRALSADEVTTNFNALRNRYGR